MPPSGIAAVGADARPLLALRVELCCLGSSPRALGASVACGLSAGALASRASPTSVLPLSRIERELEAGGLK